VSERHAAVPRDVAPVRAPALSWAQAAAWRMQQHFLVQRAPAERMLDVLAAIGGAQAQVMSCAALALWARVEGLRAGDVPAALWEQRTLVKTWAMRGTLHLLPAAELGLWHAALALDSRYVRSRAWLEYYGLDVEGVDALVNAIDRVLDGRTLTRAEIATEVAQALGRPDLAERLLGGWGSLLKPAAYRGKLCFAPGEGQNVRFTNPASWLGPGRAVATEAALHEVARRYFERYGPATRRDLQLWLGVTAKRAALMIAALGDDLAPVEVEGRRAWLPAAHVGAVRAVRPGGVTRLLPGFDQYTLGMSAHAASLLQGQPRNRVFRTAGWIAPVVLTDGFVTGVWRHERKGQRVTVQIEPFTPFSSIQREAVAAEVERLAGFLGGTPELRWGG